VDTCGRVLGPEQAGEILVHSPVVMTGYFGGPKERQRPFEGVAAYGRDIGFLCRPTCGRWPPAQELLWGKLLRHRVREDWDSGPS